MIGRSMLVGVVLVAGACGAAERDAGGGAPSSNAREASGMQIAYLEVVTPDVDGVCATYARVYGMTFGEPVAALGGARTAETRGGGRLGVRPPLRPDEAPVVRPYVLVADIEAAVREAESAGAVVALPPMQLPGEGTCAIVVQGGVEHGLWQGPADGR